MAEIRWFGHACFRIRAKEATIITDPVARSTGYSLPKQTADIVTLSHEHKGHNNLGAIKTGYQIISRPGEYEMHDVSLIGVRTFHDDKKGTVHGHNTFFVIEVEGLHFAHLGDLGHDLTEEQAEVLDNIDVLFIAAGGGNVLGPDRAAEMVTRIAPKSVIPMQFQTASGDKQLATVESFCKQLGVEIPKPEPKLTIRPSDLKDTLQLFILDPEGDAK